MTTTWQRFATFALLVSLALLAACRSERAREHEPRIEFITPGLNVPNSGVAANQRMDVDMEAGPFAVYDAAVVAKIRQRWLDLLTNTKSEPQSGKVIVECRETSAGELMDVKVTSNAVSEPLASLCRKAVLDPAPYSPWPGDMKSAIGKDSRRVILTFHFK